jgi:hypothetical protein
LASGIAGADAGTTVRPLASTCELAGIALSPWRLVRGLVLTLLVVVLAACAGSSGDGPSNFGKSGLSGGGSKGKIPPPIALIAMNGVPSSKAGVLADALAEAAGARDIAIVQGNFSDGYQMAGVFEPVNEGGGVRLIYRWTLTGNAGAVLHTVNGQELVANTGGDPWSGVDDTVIKRIASITAENLATKLAQMGFRVRQAGVLPPSHTFARAGPNAEKEYDLETFYGPNSPLATASITPDELYSLSPEQLDKRLTEAAQRVAEERLKAAGVNTSLASLMGEDEVDDGSEPADPSERAVAAVSNLPTARPAPDPKTELASQSQPEKKATGGEAPTKIDKVALVGVTGSPGRGNDELYRAMRKVLRMAGWPVVSKPGKSTLAISGRVELGEEKGGVQQVQLAWAVMLPTGKVLGTVRQQNDVPAGSLNEGWGKTAGFAAEAAAEGIFNLVQDVR